VSSVIDGIVEELKTEWLPSLLDLWIGIVGDVQVSIDAGKNAVGELIESVGESSVEDNLSVRVVAEVILESSGRSFAVVVNVFVGKSSRFVAGLCGEVQVDGSEGALVYPGVPLNLTKDAVGVKSIIVILNPSFPGGTKNILSDTGSSVLEEVVLKELLHLFLTNHGFNVVEELEALLVRDLRESIVWVVALEYWVDTSVGVVKAISAHVTPKRSITEESFSLSKVLTVED